jgi:uncharacterized protein (DUF1697 family)
VKSGSHSAGCFQIQDLIRHDETWLRPDPVVVALPSRKPAATLDAMASVVFFRAVNVGGHQKFQPSVLAKKLADYDVVNLGAAGTLVVRERVSPAKLREAILHRLPFTPELMICSAREVLALARGEPFGGAPRREGVQRFVSVMQKVLRVTPQLPIEQPAGDKWEVQVVAMVGRFALSFRRPGPKGVYPNAVVEKLVNVPATTRNWSTIETICGILEQSPDGPA